MRRREGRYAGCVMSVYGKVVPGGPKIRHQGVSLSRQGRARLAWFEFYEGHRRNARLTCRHFGISPQTFCRWKRRYDPHDLRSLESRPSRPKKLRQPTWSPQHEAKVLELRRQFPRWAREKLATILAREGIHLSPSMVGRIVRRLKLSGRLVEPARTRGPSPFARKHRRLYAERKPWNYRVRHPGDLVELDTKHLRPLPGVKLFQFTAEDVVSRWDVLAVRDRATSHAAASFLDEMQQRFPFPIHAIQVDGGSEFKALFEKECQLRGIRLFVLPPRSPKLNGQVERAHRSHNEEFFEVYDLPWNIRPLTPHVRNWEQIHNTFRPHEALDYLTPLEFLERKALPPEGPSPPRPPSEGGGECFRKEVSRRY